MQLIGLFLGMKEVHLSHVFVQTEPLEVPDQTMKRVVIMPKHVIGTARDAP